MNEERISLIYDSRSAVAEASKANKAIETNERQAERAGEAITRATDAQATHLVRIAERSRQSINRTVANLQQRASFGSARTGVERLELERARDVSRVAGDPAAVVKVQEAYKRLIELQRESDNAALLEKATAATKRAAAGAREFEQALARLNKEKQREAELAAKAAAAETAATEQSIRALERRAAVAGKSRVQVAAIEANQQLGELTARGASAADIARATAAHRTLIEAQRGVEASSQSMGASLIGLAGKLGLVIGGAELVRRGFSAAFDATLYAAKVEQAGVALGAVARANLVAESATQRYVRATEALGTTTEDARKIVTQLIAAQLDYRRVTELVRVAQDLGRVSNTSTSESAERLVHAIVTLQPEMLRTLGLNVNLERSYREWARQNGRVADSLTETEKRLIAFNEVMRSGQAFAGTYAASIDSTGGKLLSLQRYAKQTALAFGREFQPALDKAVGVLTWLGKNGETAGQVVAIGLKAAFSPALALYERLDQVRNAIADLTKTPAQRAQDKASSDLEKRAAKLQEEVLGMLKAQRDARAASEREEEAAAEKTRKRLEDAQREREAFAKRVAEAERRSFEVLAKAREGDVQGLARIMQEHREYLRTAERNATANRNWAEAIRLRLAAEAQGELRRNAGNVVQRLQQEGELARRIDSDRYAEKLKAEEDLNSRSLQNLMDRLRLEESAYQSDRDGQLRQLESFNARTLADKSAVEAKRAAIEEQYLLKSFALKVELLNREAQLELTLAEATARARGESESIIAARRDVILQAAAGKAREIELATQGRIDAVKEGSILRLAELQRTEQERTFDLVQRQAEGLFDAMLQGARSFGDALKRIMISALLTPVKQAFTNAVATLLSGTQTAAAGAGGQGGILGRLLGGAGAALSGFGAQASAGGGAGFATSLSRAAMFSPPFVGLPGAPGGTPGFAGPVGAAGSSGKLSGLAGLGAAKLGGGLLFNSGGISLGAGSATTAAGIGGPLGTLAGFATSTAGLAAGAGLLGFGLKRGGNSGLAMSIGGGALTGAALGTMVFPGVGTAVGAAIGAAAGGVAGLLRKYLKTATDRVQDKVRQVYGITIEKGFARDPLLGIIRQQFGGNIDLGIRSPQVRDLIELYTMATGQERGGALATRSAASRFTQSAGTFTAAATYSNGQLLGSAAPIGASPQVVVRSVQLVVNGQAAADALEGRIAPVVSRSPEAVSAAQATATRFSIRRRQSAAAVLAPGVLVS